MVFATVGRDELSANLGKIWVEGWIAAQPNDGEQDLVPDAQSKGRSSADFTLAMRTREPGQLGLLPPGQDVVHQAIEFARTEPRQSSKNGWKRTHVSTVQ
jgi:hypothetical protein